MLIPFLFIIWLVVLWLYSFYFFYWMIEDPDKRTFTNFIVFVWLAMWFISIILVNKSLFNLFSEF